MAEPSLAQRRAPAVPPALGLAMGVLAVSAASIFIRSAQVAGAPSLVIAAGRLMVAAAVLLPIALARHREELRALAARDWAVAAAGGAFLAAHFAAWITSLGLTSVASSVALVTMSPIFVAVGSRVFLGELIARTAALGMLVAMAGGLAVGVGPALTGNALAGGANPALGNALALAGAIALAPYLLIGRRLRAKLSLIVYVTVVYAAAALVMLAVLLVLGLPVHGYSPEAYAWTALVGLVPQLLGHSAFNWALGYLPAAYATIPGLGEPIGSTLLAVALLGEPLPVTTIAGGALIVIGIGLMSLRPR